MKALAFSEVGKAQIVDTAKPAPASGQVRIRVKKAGICHSDIMAYRGQHPYRVPPVITGHEASGVVDALGGGISSLSVGDKVAIEPHAGCGQCEFCRHSQYNVCTNKKLIGVGSWTGVFAEYVVADASMCHRMPEGMDYETGALLEPYCVGLHAVGLAGIRKGDGVTILGCGTIGMMTLLAVAQYEPKMLAISDLSPTKRQLAFSLGASSTINPTEVDPVRYVQDLTQGYGADLVFVTAPNKVVLSQAIRMARRKGKIVLIATLPGDTEITTGEIQMHERVIMGSAMYTQSDYEEAMQQWRQGRLDGLTRLISKRIDIIEAPGLIADMAAGRQSDYIKNLISFD
jgi:L-iditol 2-dehydrogenase